MKIALLSDTHGAALGTFLPALMDLKPDLVLHAGDLAADHLPEKGLGCADSRSRQVRCFLEDWNAVADALDRPIIMVPGNHDFFLAWPPFERWTADGDKDFDWNFSHWQHSNSVPPGWIPPHIERELDPRIKILNGSGVRVRGLGLWGSPWIPSCGNWPYNFKPGAIGHADAAAHWARIPADTDILITHGPPRGILDGEFASRPYGCPFLRAELDSERIKPKLHVFGHIHGGRGQFRQGETLFVNAAMGQAASAVGVELE